MRSVGAACLPATGGMIGSKHRRGLEVPLATKPLPRLAAANG